MISVAVDKINNIISSYLPNWQVFLFKTVIPSFLFCVPIDKVIFMAEE